MAIAPVEAASSQSINAHQHRETASSQAIATHQNRETAEMSDTAKAKQQLNVQILEASAQVSMQSGDEPQNLVFHAAIDRINELLSPTLGPDAIQGKMSEDNSPDATANRILSLSTGFYDAYAAQRAGDDPDQIAKDFVAVLRGGFEKGFNEAKDILKGLQSFGDEIESGVMKTFSLVQQGYDDFLASKLQPAASEAEKEKPVLTG